jgi:hypothetical protein
MSEGPIYRGQFGAPPPSQSKMSDGPQYRGQHAPTAPGSGGGVAGVSSFNTRTGAVTLSSGDVTTALGFTPQASGTYLTAPSVLTKTTAYTEAATSGINVRLCNNASGFTVTLPTAVGNTAILTFKVLAATGAITLSPVSAQTIDGGSSAVLASQYASVSLVSDNSNWWII